MKSLQFCFSESGISQQEVRIVASRLLRLIQLLRKKPHHGSPFDFIDLPLEGNILKQVKQVALAKAKLKPAILVVIGIGGSNLGAIAVHEAINGRYYNERNPKLKVYFADTVDSSIGEILKICEGRLKRGENILLNLVTKSGSTIESIANFQVFLKLLQKYKKNYADCVVVTTDHASKLWNTAEKNGFSLVEVPAQVGGRYSVFSPVGLFPLALIGVDIDKLLAGAVEARKAALSERILSNPAAVNASLLYLHYLHRRRIYNSFYFEPRLESLGKWHRQLLAESIGKEYNASGTKRVCIGVTPIVSIGSTDLHSMCQLYLGGPDDKFTTLVKVEQQKGVTVPEKGEYEGLAANIGGKTFPKIMRAIYGGVRQAYIKRKLPFTEVVLSGESERSIGAYMQLKMMETAFLAVLMGVNAFDQPNVEEYKTETKELLSKK